LEVGVNVMEKEQKLKGMGQEQTISLDDPPEVRAGLCQAEVHGKACTHISASQQPNQREAGLFTA
jgi:hypothetical protein